MENASDKVAQIDEGEYKALIERVRSSLMNERDRKWIIAILETFRFLQAALEQKKVAIYKLKKILFGKKTEKDDLVGKGKSKEKSGETKNLRPDHNNKQ
jgi:hypothetical protein